jgi:hypothetical protein
MPSALDILKDPNYVKANTATKQAIFDRRVATLPEYRSANPATQADIRRRFNLETGKEKYIRQTRQRAEDEKSALRDTGSKIASAVSGAERGLKSVAGKLSYLNPLEYIPDPFTSKADRARIEKQRANYAAERQQANPKMFAGGKIGGEIVGTLPFTMGGGAAMQLGGRALTKVLPRAGAVIEKVGRAVTSGGAGVRAPTKAAETSGKIIAQTRRARNAYRAAGGAGSSTIAAAMTDQDMVDAALTGATVPVLGHILKFGAGKTYDLIMGRAGPVEAARILREVISDNATKIASALRNAPKDIKASTAEFLAERGLLTSDLAAATRIATGSKQGGKLLELAGTRAEGKNRMRQIIAGGENQTKAITNINATKKALQDETAIQREQVLGSADIGRIVIAPAERRAAQARTALQNELDTAAKYMDDPNFDARISQYLEDARSADEVAANLRAQGLEKLDISKVVANLRAEADKAEFVSPDRFRILSEFANNLQRRAAKMNGVIDAQGLYLARREMGNFVSSILGTSDPKALREGTAQLVAAAQQPIDEAIEAAGGAGWKNYLDTFANGMKGIERQHLQRELAALPDPDLAKVMAGGDPDWVTSKLGPGRFDINLEMEGADLATANKLGRIIQAEEDVADTGMGKLSKAQKLNFEQGVTAKVGGMLEPPVPNVFTAGARLAGSLPKIGGGGVAAQQFGVKAAENASKRTMNALVPALASPREAGALLRVKPAEDYINKMLYGSQGSPARQQVVSQIATQNVRPQTIGEQYGFPDIDPESGQQLVDIDFSEGYPVPIYGRMPKDKTFIKFNSMRR